MKASEIKKFKQNYQFLKRTYEKIKNGSLTYEELHDLRDKYKTIEEFEQDIFNQICDYEHTIYMIYNMDGSINKREFDKFYKKFVVADEKERKLYEENNGQQYKMILSFLEKNKKKLESSSIDFDKISRRLNQIESDFEKMSKLKTELIKLGIAEDDGNPNAIHVKPEKFVDYLEFLEEHPELRI